MNGKTWINKEGKTEEAAALQGLLQANDFIQAKVFCQNWLEKAPHSEEALQCCGLFYVKTQELEKAIACFEQAILENPNNAGFHNNLGNAYLANGNLEKAKQHFNQTLRLDTQHAEGYNNLGRLYYSQNLFSEAAPFFEKALRINPDYWEAHYNLAHNAVKQNQVSKAIDHYREVVRLNPQHMNAELNLGLLLFEEGAYEESKIHLSKAFEMDPNNVNAVYYLANVELLLGNTEPAFTLFEKTIELSPNFAEAHHNLAVLYLRRQDNTNALKSFETTLRLQPENETAKHMVHALQGDQTERVAPREYVTALFDQYAPHYNKHIKDSLHYGVPGLLRDAVGRVLQDSKKAGRILDLGCGTGLCGIYFRDLARELIGVDLSPKMIAQAEVLGAYDKLVVEDLNDYLKTPNLEPFDMIISGDVLVYIGDLEPSIEGVAGALTPGGHFAFTTETLEEREGDNLEDYHLNTTGRFTHSRKYIHRIIENAGFQLVFEENITPRENEGKKVVGDLYVCTRV